MFLFNFRKPVLMIVMLNLIGYVLLAFSGTAFDVNMLYLGGCVTLALSISYFVISRMSLQDEYIFLIVAMMFSIGEIMLCRLDPFFAKKQVVWLGISLVCFFIVYFAVIKFDVWKKLKFTYFISAIVLFIVTLGIGTTLGGSRNWIVIGNISIQPSELIKLLIVFMLADRYSTPDRYRLKIPKTQILLNEDIVCSVMVYIMLGFMVLQREWGTSVLIFFVHISLMFVFSPDKKIMLANIALACVGGMLGFFFVSRISVRVDTWINPWSDMAGKGYQITQALFAIGSGGFFGTGLGLGSPEYIPEVHSDFIFAAICEEFGVLGGIAVIMLYFLLMYRGIRLSMKISDVFYKCVASGISILFGFQAFIILGGVTRLIPLTGITLPFMSYGGSSVLAI
jgi:cell division protein FtsW (lipid II flippase)